MNLETRKSNRSCILYGLIIWSLISWMKWWRCDNWIWQINIASSFKNIFPHRKRTQPWRYPLPYLFTAPVPEPCLALSSGNWVTIISEFSKDPENKFSAHAGMGLHFLTETAFGGYPLSITSIWSQWSPRHCSPSEEKLKMAFYRYFLFISFVWN